ncbi:MAG: methyltransferase domain-containing protein [Candidatus Brocadiales bacterium]
MRRLDLGCGPNKKEGYIGIDTHPYPRVDVVRDVDRHGLPFDDDSVDEVRAHHFLEHCHDLIFVMNEICRVLRPGGRLVAIVPIVEVGTGAFRDPTHVRYFNKDSFLYFTGHPWTYHGLGIRPFRLADQGIGQDDMTVVLEKPKECNV